MTDEPAKPSGRRFDDKKGRWWILTWRPASGDAPAGYLFRAEDGGDEVFMPGTEAMDARAVERISLGDARQLLWMARSGLV